MTAHPMPANHASIAFGNLRQPLFKTSQPPVKLEDEMAPDRGSGQSEDDAREGPSNPSEARLEAAKVLAARADEPQNFTFRGVLVGLVIGILICFSNMYFGLQTGWVSGMAMPSALLGFAYFKTVSKYISYPFTPVENVLVQSVAGSVGTMPLGCGFVGVMPALNFLLTSDEGGPLRIGLWKLTVWAFGIAFFGVVFAVPLRRQVIIREKLKFPSGTATALMIGVLHGEKPDAKIITQNGTKTGEEPGSLEDSVQSTEMLSPREEERPDFDNNNVGENFTKAQDARNDWKARLRLLLISFAISGLYTFISYFLPQIRDLPIFGLTLANNWLWTINPSPAYVGQGIIMGPATTNHMLLGAVIGWGILSPLAKNKGWAPGNVDDWVNGSKGWIVWISLAIMLADSLISLGWLILRPVILYGPAFARHCQQALSNSDWRAIIKFDSNATKGYSAVSGSEDVDTPTVAKFQASQEEADAPPHHLIGTRTTLIGLVLSLGLCIGAVHYSFASLIPLQLTLLALFLALFLSVMGVRALGETDLNPVSGISKLTQLLFAFVVPASNKNAVIINLIAGALSESGALQAGDLMQDLKAGHLLGAAPNAQFYGQIIGSAVGAVVSAAVYKLYTHVYTIPGDLFEVPTAYVWVFTARLVTGQGLPPMVAEWALVSGLIFAVATAARVWARSQSGWKRRLTNWIPGGIAVAVGMYNTPSFTLARAAGGFIHLYWSYYRKKPETPIIVLASGLILGEGLFSIVNLGLASLAVPHL
ncbi:oligopeptide transporter-like protein [Tothia fuscella]|uniref:Oligopeptide transporter-like protein n=1 Tax=Tothia fuscella TaxID=1048955 RepID=A0A9P4NWG9_9PEZI|nr:oligopeptide transporter-like protein [Tothia fuscella]